jgi:hypothetical protein
MLNLALNGKGVQAGSRDIRIDACAIVLNGATFGTKSKI